MTEDIFTDMVGEIRLEGGMVRVDLVSYSGGKHDDEGRPVPFIKGRLVMPPEGFLRTFATLERFIKKLKEAGVLVPRAGTKETVRETAGAPLI